ncbi:hypothetical protein [Polyangium sp. 15x6]|uniref:hypothetical protein n=1 Tax=Polyangium sp. 15x6 TaxID=3042687 RepID=UPI002499B52A|nr:hypothetical protein [Polyangium sp. 15x6]MDI3283710.1 hypothetical protein [Polyangium sp. 15x6]
MKKTLGFLMAVGVLSGCSYGGIATVGDKVVITRNDLFLFGALRKVYVCKVADRGLTECAADGETP